MREIFLLAFLFIVVLLVNYPVISFDMIYVEQPTIYAANQLIHSWRDLLDVYTHPQLLDGAIPFFRPTGHFLIYQLLTPYLGWQNNKAYLMVNFLFLALTGYVLVKLYRLLFPKMRMGGYVAFSILLMHPALTLSRFITLHFEFMYIFFSVFCLYCFIRFWQCRRQSWLISSLLLYVIACTCKEGAILLGPVMVFYLLVSFYDGQSIKKSFYYLLQAKQARQVVILITLLTIVLFTYFTLSWPGLIHPAKEHVHLSQLPIMSAKFLSYLFGFKPKTSIDINVWTSVVYPLITRLILWILIVVAFISTFMLPKADVAYQKSLLFLYGTTALFLILPIMWGMGMPWHLGLALLMFSLIAGFGWEFFWAYCLPRHSSIATTIVILTAFGIGVTTVLVNRVNIQLKEKQISLHLSLVKNAIEHPPVNRNKLNANSVIVVEDNILLNDYQIGNSHFPLIFVQKFDYRILAKVNHLNFVKIYPEYNGKLFQFAYLMPTLREEEVPFRMDNMKDVPDEILYGWLQQYPNIFSVTYDEHGNWHDRTGIFKRTILNEQKRRHLRVSHYEVVSKTAMNGKLVHVIDLPFPDSVICQEMCDKDHRCAGFTFIDAELPKEYIKRCYFMAKPMVKVNKPCAYCTTYVRQGKAI